MKFGAVAGYDGSLYTLGWLLSCCSFTPSSSAVPAIPSLAIERIAAEPAPRRAVMQSLCNQDVLTMLGGGLDADIVIETIRGSFCGFDVSVQTLMELKKSGVPAAVIKGMVKGNRKPVGAR